MKMNIREQRLFPEEVRQTDMVDYLSEAGHERVKIRTNDYWYLFPLRDEKTPSFKVNRQLSKWFDHAMGRDGNIIDFALLYYNCPVAEFLQKARDNFSFQQPNTSKTALQVKESTESKILIVDEKLRSSFALYHYLLEMKISIEVAGHFCKEITYPLNEKEYFGIGFKNDSGGCELRNPYFKASSSPKDITTLNNHAKKAIVYNGFFDFLSFITINVNRQGIARDYVILNSVSFFEKARPFWATQNDQPILGQ